MVVFKVLGVMFDDQPQFGLLQSMGFHLPSNWPECDGSDNKQPHESFRLACV
jgi:hypothetical protein